MLFRRIVSISLSCLLFVSIAGAQSLQSGVSVFVGATQRVHYGVDDRDYLPIVEVEFAIGKLSQGGSGVSVSGAAHLGYWEEGTSESSFCADCVVFSYKAATVGARGLVHLDRAPIPLSFVLGYSHHAVFATYEGGAGIIGNIGSDHTVRLNLAEVGVRVLIPVIDRLRIGPEALSVHKINADPDEPYQHQWRFGLRTEFQFN